MKRIRQRALEIVSGIGADPSDDEDTRLQKTLLVLGAGMFIVAGALWGGMYLGFGEVGPGLIPLSYAIISLISIVVFAVTRRYRLFRFSQLALILLLPFLLQLSLGGFINSSAVILWSLICPLGALLFDEPRRTPGWLLAYLGLVAASGVLEPWARAVHPVPLSPALLTLFFVMNVGGVSAIVITLLAYFVTQKNLFFGLLRQEQAKAENLLLNILPPEIAAILKNENRTIADHYDGASVMFADMVGFTPLTAELAPTEMLNLLNEVFSYFDTLVEKYGAEKIRTIGDSYMVAAGVPRPRPDHAQVLTRMALEMRDYLNTHTFSGNRRVNFRIGINSGPLVAGVIGRKKFIYDIWGDSVNTASRMESHGQAGQIQITRATYELINDSFVCEPRGTIQVKGKGDMDVWHVTGVKS